MLSRLAARANMSRIKIRWKAATKPNQLLHSSLRVFSEKEPVSSTPSIATSTTT